MRKSKPTPIAEGLGRGGLLFLQQPRGSANPADTPGPRACLSGQLTRGGLQQVRKSKPTPIAEGLGRGGLLFLQQPRGSANPADSPAPEHARQAAHARGPPTSAKKQADPDSRRLR
ncbi:hypothetical protein AK95_01850 [Paenibacillus sp. LC231]|nr:hypothetical protein AK95_01845 [Paenibacillus sp. LC231]OIB01660.1 hypothetical protein AK95_01850 [Paenibacillus sp. LC231]